MSETSPLLGQHSGTWRMLWWHCPEAVSRVFMGRSREITKGEDDEAPAPPSHKAPTVRLNVACSADSESSDSSTSIHHSTFQTGSLASNGFLCVFLVAVSIYEVILKEKTVSRQAVSARPFNLHSLIIWNSVFSIIVGVVVSAYTGEMTLLLNSNTLRVVAKCMLPGCAFSFAAYLQFVILLYLPSDLFKVLEQSRLLVTALISFVMLGRRQARISWIMLVIVTFASATYGVVRISSPTAERHHDLLLFAKNLLGRDGYNVTQQGVGGLDAALFPSEIVGCVGQACRHSRAPNQTALAALLAGRRGLRSIKQLLAKEELAEEIGKYMREAQFESATEPHLLGLMLTFVFVLTTCVASVSSEQILKDHGYLPFYIQKVCLEVPVLLFALLNMQVISPWLASKGIGRFSPAEAFFVDPFGGWDSQLVMLTFFFLAMKSWFSGLCVKALSALTKQVCGVVAVAMTYFFTLLHKCQAPLYHSTDFFCPLGLLDVSWEVSMADILVFVTVATYVLVQIDHGDDMPYGKDDKL